MNSNDAVKLLIWVILGSIFGVALAIYGSSKVQVQTKISSTCTIPATEWKCEVNAETKEIICKGVMK